MKLRFSFSSLMAVKIVAIALLSIIATILYMKGAWLFTLISGTIALIPAASLFHSLKTAKQASQLLLEAIEKNDGSFHLSSDKTDPHIASDINRIKRILSEKQNKIAEQEQFFKEIISLVNTGIIVMSADGKITLNNNRALELLHRSVFTHIRQLESTDPALYRTLSDITAGETRQITTSTDSLLVHANFIDTSGVKLKIITIDDIDTVLADRDMDSWARYSSVIMHELMNSLTPIASISRQMLDAAEIPDRDVKANIEPIYSCSTYLINFVEGLKTLNQLPDPDLSLFGLLPFLNRAATLASHIHQFPLDNINIACDDSLYVNTDESLLGQVMTNLLKNSIEAVSGIERPEISISGYCDERENIVIEITNNGPEIPETIAPKIFIPFFTTKPSGSGIGLSLSRQLIRRCGGTLKIAGTSPHPTFRITIP
ncbi:MAG: ATP-binding protein [Bacteroides sp.]|nr:ATP-binding protein [Bacteroides sp.]MCM1389638.1 ATP-binding protein [Bacteroides sp.]